MSATEKELDRLNRELMALKTMLKEMGEMTPQPDTSENLRVI